MKKTVLLVLASVLILVSLAACGSGSGSSAPPQTNGTANPVANTTAPTVADNEKDTPTPEDSNAEVICEGQQFRVLRTNISARYESVGDAFGDGLLKVSTDGVHYGYIDSNGQEIIPPIYGRSSSDFNEGLAAVHTYGSITSDSASYRFGFVDTSGKVVIPLEYEGAKGFSEGLAAVKKDGKWGFIDASGQVVIPFEYAETGSFSNGMAVVTNGEIPRDKACGYIDKTGELVIPCKYINGFGTLLPGFRDGFTFGWYDDYQGKYDGHLLNAKGEIVLTVETKLIGETQIMWGEGIVFTVYPQKVDKETVYDTVCYNYDGNEISAPGVIKFDDYKALGNAEWRDYFWALGYSDNDGADPSGLVRFFVMDENINSHYGFVDMDGNIVVPAKYGSVSYFNSGIAFAYLDNEVYILDMQGNEYKTGWKSDGRGVGGTRFKDGIALVQVENEQFIIQIEGTPPGLGEGVSGQK